MQIKLSKTKNVTCGTHWLVGDLEKKEFQKDDKHCPFYELSGVPTEAGAQTCGDSTQYKAELPVKGNGYFMPQTSLLVAYYPKDIEFGYKRGLSNKISGNQPFRSALQNPFGVR